MKFKIDRYEVIGNSKRVIVDVLDDNGNPIGQTLSFFVKAEAGDDVIQERLSRIAYQMTPPKVIEVNKVVDVTPLPPKNIVPPKKKLDSIVVKDITKDIGKTNQNIIKKPMI